MDAILDFGFAITMCPFHLCGTFDIHVGRGDLVCTTPAMYGKYYATMPNVGTIIVDADGLLESCCMYLSKMKL